MVKIYTIEKEGTTGSTLVVTGLSDRQEILIAYMNEWLSVQMRTRRNLPGLFCQGYRLEGQHKSVRFDAFISTPLDWRRYLHFDEHDAADIKMFIKELADADFENEKNPYTDDRFDRICQNW